LCCKPTRLGNYAFPKSVNILECMIIHSSKGQSQAPIEAKESGSSELTQRNVRAYTPTRGNVQLDASATIDLGDGNRECGTTGHAKVALESSAHVGKCSGSDQSSDANLHFALVNLGGWNVMYPDLRE
jgi:hypothetical protein